jgi:hypothetical protein
LEEFKFEPVVYSGDDVMRQFYDFLINESTKIDEILIRNEIIKRLTALEQKSHDEPITCFKYDKQFCEINRKTPNHCHVIVLYYAAGNAPYVNNTRLRIASATMLPVSM